MREPGVLPSQTAFRAAALAAAAAAKTMKTGGTGKDFQQAQADLEAELAVLQELMVSHASR
jgi:hypothetical protein